MNKTAPIDNAAVRQAYEAYERQQRIINTKVGSALVVFLMPAGTLLDWAVYPDHIFDFLTLRIVCSTAAALIWVFLFTELGKRCARTLGMVVPLLPVVFIAAMIAQKDGFSSPYYAGLNLVLLAVGAVLHWTILESIIAVLLVLFIYTGAGIIHASHAG